MILAACQLKSCRDLSYIRLTLFLLLEDATQAGNLGCRLLPLLSPILCPLGRNFGDSLQAKQVSPLHLILDPFWVEMHSV
jgi:hypothetical protein